MAELEDTLKNTPLPELEALRRRIIASCAGDYERLSTDDLHNLALIAANFRRRNAGPSTAAKVAARQRKTEPKKSFTDLLDGF